MIPMLSVVAVAPHCVMAVPDIHPVRPVRVRSLLLSTVNISERFRTSMLDHYRLVYYIYNYIIHILYHILYSTISYYTIERH